MHLFGCKFASERDGDTQPDRKNFDSLLWAIVTVFQVSITVKYSHFTTLWPIELQLFCLNSHSVEEVRIQQQDELKVSKFIYHLDALPNTSFIPHLKTLFYCKGKNMALNYKYVS